MIFSDIYYKYPLSLLIVSSWIQQVPQRLLWTPAAVLPCWQPVTAQVSSFRGGTRGSLVKFDCCVRSILAANHQFLHWPVEAGLSEHWALNWFNSATQSNGFSITKHLFWGTSLYGTPQMMLYKWCKMMLDVMMLAEARDKPWYCWLQYSRWPMEFHSCNNFNEGGYNINKYIYNIYIYWFSISHNMQWYAIICHAKIAHGWAPTSPNGIVRAVSIFSSQGTYSLPTWTRLGNELGGSFLL